MTQEQWLRFYLARRAGLEPAAWILFLLGLAFANASTVIMDVRRMGLDFQNWEVITWELSSALMWILLVPWMIRGLDARPLRWGLWRRHLPWHLLFSVLVSLAHVGGMVAIRKLVYLSQGARYDFGDWPRELVYEGIKDVRSYVFVLVIVGSYRLLLWRWQGEASELSPPPGPLAETPAPDASVAATPSAPFASTPEEVLPARADLPERLLVKKLGTEFLLPVEQIEWVQACGNYVNLHRDRHDYPLRSTLAAFEQRLDPGQFVRVHRSYLVRWSLIEAIEPTEAGDAQLRLRDGSRLPCSRTHLERLRLRLSGDAAA